MSRSPNPLQVDDLLSFRDEYGRKYRHEGGKCVLRNPLGWEMRHVTPAWHFVGGTTASHRLSRLWRWDVYRPDGSFMTSEPSSRDALCALVNEMVVWRPQTA